MKNLFVKKQNENEGKLELRKNKGLDKIIIVVLLLLLSVGIYTIFQDSINPIFTSLIGKVTKNLQGIIGTP